MIADTPGFSSFELLNITKDTLPNVSRFLLNIKIIVNLEDAYI